MANQTKADLAVQLSAAIELNGVYRERLRNIDDEALALGEIIRSLKPFDKSGSGYSYNPQASTSISRILTAAAARFGIRPDWETFRQLDELIRLTDQERAELNRFRAEWEIKNRA